MSNFYKIIFKNTGLFAVSQIIGILARLVCNKVAAVFIGPTGIGVIGLIDNILRLVRGVTNFGIAVSSVREIAVLEEEAGHSNLKSQRLIKVIYKWALATGFLGLFVVVFFSKYISQIIFETDSKYLWIIGLSSFFLFNSISSMRLAVLQAKKKVNKIVLYNIFSSIISSAIAIIGYYIYGISSIIPVIILTAVVNFLLSIYFTKSIAVSKDKIALKQLFNEGLPIAKLGLLLSVSAIFGELCFYIIRWFLKANYSFEVLGVYQVGNTFLVSYIGLVFAAMSNDYYPRLCNLDSDKTQFDNLVNDQTELALLIIVPAVLILYVMAPYLVPLLYTEAFLDVLLILKVGLLSIILKAIVWPIGFIALTKGNKKLFLKQNVLGNIINLIFSVFGFYYFGLLGLGIAMVIMFSVSGIYNYITVVKYYNFKYRRNTLKVMFTSLIICVLVLLVFVFYSFDGFNVLLFVIALLSAIYSVLQLKSRLMK